MGAKKGLHVGYPQENPSSIENNGILLDLHNNQGALAYGIEEFENENPLAWPGFATVDDVTGLPPVVISVDECDPSSRRGNQFLPSSPARRSPRSVSTAHGHVARRGHHADPLPRDQSRNGAQHRRLLSRVLRENNQTPPARNGTEPPRWRRGGGRGNGVCDPINDGFQRDFGGNLRRMSDIAAVCTTVHWRTRR